MHKEVRVTITPGTILTALLVLFGAYILWLLRDLALLVVTALHQVGVRRKCCASKHQLQCNRMPFRFGTQSRIGRIFIPRNLGRVSRKIIVINRRLPTLVRW